MGTTYVQRNGQPRLLVSNFSPIGARSKNIGSSTNLNVPALNSIKGNSLIVALLCSAFGPPSVIPNPTNFTSRDSGNDAAFAWRVSDEPLVAAGAASDPVSVAISTDPWSGFLIEVEGNGSVPSYVNAGTEAEGTSTSATAALPGSRVIGNLLVATVQVTGGNVTFASAGGGWTLEDQITLASGSSSCFAWRYVDSSEAAPTITVDLTTWGCRVYQFSNVIPHP
jgi:hypothetical protein